MSGTTIDWRRSSIRLRIGLAFAALALVLFTTVGVLSGQQARRQIEEETGAALAQVASRMAVTLDAGMYERQREIYNLSALESLLDSPVRPAAWRALIERLQSSFPHYSWIGVTDADGRVIAGTGGLLQGADVTKRPWFAHGLEQPFVGDVHEALMLAKLLPRPANNEPLRLVDFSAPVRRGDRLTGVLGAHLSIAWIEERRRQVLDSLDPARRVEIFILDGNGKVMLGPAEPGRPPPLAAGLDALGTRGHALAEWRDGGRYLSAAARSAGYQSFAGLGWTVLVRQPEATAMVGADRLERRIQAFGLMGAVLFGAIGWWLAGWLTHALRAVVRRAQSFTAGDAPPAAVGKHDEVAQLASSLETLVGQLRRREQELLSANESLEARVQTRTQSLHQTNADLRSFCRSVSHDIKGPIASIGMVLKNLLQREAATLGAGPTRMLSMLVAECQRLGVLVDELMTLAMVEQRELRALPVSMQALVQTVVDDLQAQPLPDTTARAEIVVQPLPEVQGDDVLLRQVWQNLLGNALKFSARKAQPRVEIRAEQGAREIVFSVSDNGAGFDMALAPRLFGVFQRLHTAADFQGTGVGLSIVKRVVHRHGGRVWAQSSPGQGAQFYFALPAGAPHFAGDEGARR